MPSLKNKELEDEMKQVGRDLAKKGITSLSHLHKCIECRGSGKIKDVECGICHGTGEPNYLDVYNSEHMPNERLEEDHWVFI